MKKLIALIIAIVLMSGLAGCTGDSSLGEVSKAETSSTSETIREIYQDDLITMSFVEKKDEPSFSGVFYFYIKVENKSSSPITVYLEDAYVNNTMFTVMSGMPMSNIQSGKNATHGFFGNYDGTGISSVEEIKKLGFKIKLEDESYREIKTTEYVEINF